MPDRGRNLAQGKRLCPKAVYPRPAGAPGDVRDTGGRFVPGNADGETRFPRQGPANQRRDRRIQKKIILDLIAFQKFHRGGFEPVFFRVEDERADASPLAIGFEPGLEGLSQLERVVR